MSPDRAAVVMSKVCNGLISFLLCSLFLITFFSVSRVVNQWGPMTKLMRPTYNPSGPSSPKKEEPSTRIPEGVEERLRNMESHLKLKSGIHHHWQYLIPLPLGALHDVFFLTSRQFLKPNHPPFLSQRRLLRAPGRLHTDKGVRRSNPVPGRHLARLFCQQREFCSLSNAIWEPEGGCNVTY